MTIAISRWLLLQTIMSIMLLSTCWREASRESNTDQGESNKGAEVCI